MSAPHDPADTAYRPLRGVPILPGVSTPTEIELGLAQGLGTFKFFPAEAAGGVRYPAAVGRPYPDVRFVPTGGIDPGNLAAYLLLPNVLARSAFRPSAAGSCGDRPGRRGAAPAPNSFARYRAGRYARPARLPSRAVLPGSTRARRGQGA